MIIEGRGQCTWTEMSTLRGERLVAPNTPLTCSVHQTVGGQQLQRVHLEQQRMEEQVARRRAVLRPHAQALGDKVLLLGVLQAVDGAGDVLVGDQHAGVAVALDLQGGHFQGADAEREDVDGRRQRGWMDEVFFALACAAGNVCSPTLTSVLGRKEMHVAHVLAARLHVMVYRVGRHAADLHQSVVLNKYCITGEVAVDHWRRAGMQITAGDTDGRLARFDKAESGRRRRGVPEGGQDLRAPSLPRLQRQLLHVPLSPF